MEGQVPGVREGADETVAGDACGSPREDDAHPEYENLEGDLEDAVSKTDHADSETGRGGVRVEVEDGGRRE